MYIISIVIINYNNINIFILLINIRILNKLGMPPFYYWYLKIINNLSWINILLLSTIQKIIPILILRNLFNLINSNFLIINLFLIIIYIIYRSIIGLFQSNLKYLICYSSIIQICWILIILLFNEIICIIYFLIYRITSINIFYLINKFKINNLVSLSYLKINNLLVFYQINIYMYSFASLPPFFGFINKLIIVQNLRNLLPFLTILIIIFRSLIRILFYLRLSFNNIIINSVSIKLNYKFNKIFYSMNYTMLFLIWISIIIILIYEIL